MGLSPVSVISRCEQARPPYTPWTGGQNRDVLLRDSSLRSRPVLQHNLEPGTSHEAELWPLPFCPCLAPPSPPVTGRRWLHTSRKRVRARISGRARPRPGRIRPSFQKRLTAPFETEPTTPAAHASCRGHLQVKSQLPLQRVLGKKRDQVSFFGGFLGLPGGRNEGRRPRTSAGCSCHASSP